MQSQGIHSAASPQPGSPVNFTDFADLPDDRVRPARKSKPKVNRLPFRVGEMKRLRADLYGQHLPDTEDARHFLLPYVHHLVLLNGPERARREALRLMPELTDAEIADMVCDACWWEDDELGVYLELSDADRTRLKIRTIGAIDCLRAERLKRRRRNRRDAERARRAAAGAKSRRQSAEQTRPWEQEGISRRTWYRRRSNGTDGTDARPTSLTDDRPARAVPDAAPAGEAFPHIETERAASKAVPGKASPPAAPIDTTRADSAKEAGRGEVSDGPVTAIGTEFAENAIRKDFVATEMHAIREAVSKVMQAEAKQRQLEAAKQGAVHGKEGGRGKKKPLGAKSPKGKRAPKSAELVAEFAGTSATTMRKIAKVMEAAKADPDKYGDLVAMMDAGNVNAADLAARLDYRRRREAWDLKRRQRAAIIAARLRDGIEIGAGEKIVLDRVEKERQARAEASRLRQEAERQASPIYQRMIARKHAATVDAVRLGLLPASILEGRAA